MFQVKRSSSKLPDRCRTNSSFWLRWACRAASAGLGLAYGSELGATDPRTGKQPQPVPPPAAKEKEACSAGKHGTAVEFLVSPQEAARWAKREEKLVFVLHVSGHFEDPQFT